MRDEVWVDIPGSDNAQVSNYGQVRRNGKLCKQYYDSEGYARVTVGGQRGRDRVHRFVAMAFCHQPPGKDRVNHKNGRKNDNHSTNLEWSTNRENLMLARKKFAQPHHKTPVVVEKDGEKRTFSSQASAAKWIGCNNSEVNKMLHGKRKTCHGYVIRYLDGEDADRAIDAETGQMRLVLT